METFGNRLRARVSGICIENGNVLLVNHKGLYEHDFWAPPGGGMRFGETAEQALQREFEEETGLKISVVKFLFVHEFLSSSLHAVELFFEVAVEGGMMKTGKDPELPDDKQIISEIKFASPDFIKEKLQQNCLHNLFNFTGGVLDILNMKGYYLQNSL